MTKKTVLIASVIFFLLTVFYGVDTYNKNKKTINETVPLKNQTTPPKTNTIKNQQQVFYRVPETNVQQIANTQKSDNSVIEINKLTDLLPHRVENFTTSNNINTTINIYSSSSDPNSVIRIEIYNINYNNTDISGKDAIAFKDSFLEAKKFLIKNKINLKNLQIIYGNRQYIQSTANYWVKNLDLLN